MDKDYFKRRVLQEIICAHKACAEQPGIPTSVILGIMLGRVIHEEFTEPDDESRAALHECLSRFQVHLPADDTEPQADESDPLESLAHRGQPRLRLIH